MHQRFPVWTALIACVWAIGGVRAFAQVDHTNHPAPAAQSAWTWTWDANVFAGWNYQYRKFRDFQELESQNWLRL